MTTAIHESVGALLPRPADTEVAKTLGLGRKSRAGRVLRVAPLLAALAIAGLVGVRFYLARAASGRPTYETAALSRGDLRVTVATTGSVEGLNTVEVGAEVSGRVLRVAADYNERVHKGQVLAEIDPEQLRASAVQTRAQAAAARAAIVEVTATVEQTRLAAARTRALHAEGLSTKQDVEAAAAAAARAAASLSSARAQAEVARATVAQADYKLGRAIIVSPIDGIVLARLVEPGQTVTAGFQTPILFKLAEDLSRMALHVNLDEADMGHVREGQEATFTVDAYPERTFASRVESLRNEPKRSQNVVTYEGVLTVDNTEGLLRPGMTATATIVVDTKHDVLLIPNAALRFAPPDPKAKSAQTSAPPRGGERRVWVPADAAARPVSIRIGATDGQLTEVVGGELEPRSSVIVDARNK